MAILITWNDEATGSIGVIRLDSVQTESPEDAMTITDHPVEQGANVVDHAREEPTRLSIEGLVSSLPNPRVDKDTGFQSIELSVPVAIAPGNQTIKLEPPKPPLALTPGGLIQAGVVGLVDLVTGGPNYNATFRDADYVQAVAHPKAQLLKQNSPRSRTRDVYEALLRVQSARTLVTVNTRDRDYFDMMIERVAKPRAADDGSSARFQIDFKRIRVAASKTVASPKPTEERGKGNANKGSQAAKAEAEPKATKRKTLLKAGLDAL